jgi:hypothetical protein
MKRQILISLILLGAVLKVNAQDDLNMGTHKIIFSDCGPGGNTQISNNSTSIPYIGEWKFKSDYSNIILDAGMNSSNLRTILFNIGGVNKLSLNKDALDLGTTPIIFFDGGPGGNNMISNNSTSVPYIGEWKFKSDYSNIILDAGMNSINLRTILFKIGGITQVKITSGLFNVCGTLRANEVNVNLQGGCDFVFKSDYKLMGLRELERFVKINQHLPEIAPEKEMVENGVNMKELQMKLLQKIEELTLYTIEQNKAIEDLKQVVKVQNEKIKKIESASK